MCEAIKRLRAKNGGHVPLLDASTDLKVSGSQYRKFQGKLRKCLNMLQDNRLFKYGLVYYVPRVSICCRHTHFLFDCPCSGKCECLTQQH